MMSNFRIDILANVEESVAQMYHDFGYHEDTNSGDDLVQQGVNTVSRIEHLTEKSHEARILTRFPLSSLWRKSRAAY